MHSEKPSQTLRLQVSALRGGYDSPTLVVAHFNMGFSYEQNEALVTKAMQESRVPFCPHLIAAPKFMNASIGVN